VLVSDWIAVTERRKQIQKLNWSPNPLVC